MKSSFGAALGAAGLILGIGAGTAGVAVADGQDGPYRPAADTIVKVTGDKLEGFEILRYDGSGLFPPTDSEARAECRGYDTRVARVRCRTEVRVWYRDLADLKQALNYAQSLQAER